MATNSTAPMIWEQQRVFRVGLEEAARSVFLRLDPKLNPSLMLLGLRLDEKLGGEEVVVDPPDPEFSENIFIDFLHMLRQMMPKAERERASGEHYQLSSGRQTQRIDSESTMSGIEGVLRREDAKRGMATYSSNPVIIRGYLVTALLRLDRGAMSGHPTLKKNKVMGRYRVATSLIDAACMKFLEECVDALERNDISLSGGRLARKADELMRGAGDQLMYTPAVATMMLDNLDLFETCNVISSLRYETSAARGKLIVARRGHPAIEPKLQLAADVKLAEYRAVRKLLQIASASATTALLSDSSTIYGLGGIKQDALKADAEDLFEIVFLEHYTWELRQGGKTLMVVKYGQPALPKSRLDEGRFRNEVGKVFPKLAQAALDLLWTLMHAAAEQRHGTMLVITDAAAKEATRLGTQSIAIRAQRLSAEVVRQVTEIDGAVLIDTEGVCHAIGVILDGKASKQGDPSRGARYNSAIRYVDSSESPCVAVVVSEDGMINGVGMSINGANRTLSFF